jgi:hypothetical protein
MSGDAMGSSVHDDVISGPALEAEIEAFKRDVDTTLLRENLKLSVEQRLLQLIAQARLADEFDRASSSRART